MKGGYPELIMQAQQGIIRDRVRTAELEEHLRLLFPVMMRKMAKALAKSNTDTKASTLAIIIPIEVLEAPKCSSLLQYCGIAPGFNMVTTYVKTQELKCPDSFPFPFHYHPDSDGVMYCEVYYNRRENPLVWYGDISSNPSHRVMFQTCTDYHAYLLKLSPSKATPDDMSTIANGIWNLFGATKTERESRILTEAFQRGEQLPTHFEEQIATLRKCKCCGIVGKGFKLCSGCWEIYYCGKDCQVKDWKLHKKTCDKIK